MWKTIVIILSIILSIILGIVILNIILGWIEWVWGKRGPMTDLRLEMAWGMKGGSHGTRFRVDNRDNGRGYVLFLKQNPTDTRAHFLMIVREDACEGDDWKRLLECLDRQGVQYAVNMGRKGNSLEANFDRDVDRAAEICRAILMEMWNVAPDARLRFGFKGPVWSKVDSTGEPVWNDGF